MNNRSIKMRVISFIILFTLLSSTLIAQIEFIEHTIPSNPPYSPHEIHCCDYDGDGDQDILTGHDFSGISDKIISNTNSDGLGDIDSSVELNDEANNPISIISADFNGDGDLDLAAISYSIYDYVYWIENTGGDTPYDQESQISDENGYPREIYPGDIDGDGDIDIVLAKGTDATSGITQGLVLYRNSDGLGNFVRETISFEHVTSIILCDIDADEDLDIVAGNFYDGNLYWYENNGSGTFSNPETISDIDYIKSIDCADFNNDSHIDIVISSWNDYNIVWYENDGSGEFTEHTVLGYNEASTIKVLAADMNNDGHIDLVAIPDDAYKIVWYENTDGLGVFAEEQIIADDLYNVKDFELSDLNGDGKMDVVAIYSSANGNVWYENTGLASNKIEGVITVDSDLNGCDPLDIAVPNVMLTADNGEETISTFTLENGYYQLFPDSGDYTLNINPYYLDYYTSLPQYYEHSFTGIDSIVIDSFCLEPISGINDLIISAYPVDYARPGFDASYEIIFQNIGPTILSGSVSLTFDSTLISFLNASESIIYESADSLVFDYTNLTPFEYQSIELTFSVDEPPIANIGDTLHFSAQISPTIGDATLDNNFHEFDQIIVGSYDPNDIYVTEGEELSINQVDEYLHYRIRFQNTGNFYATFVRVENELSENLDWSSFQLESTSHDCIVEITNGNEVSFMFNAIYLPDSATDKVHSHGYILYKIKPRSDELIIGDIISNEADIYFDFNPPIYTNTVHTEIVEQVFTGVESYAINNIKVFPNPLKNTLYIDSSIEIFSIKIINSLGQLSLSYSYKNEIDVSSLDKGLYFIIIEDKKGRTFTQKIIKN